MTDPTTPTISDGAVERVAQAIWMTGQDWDDRSTWAGLPDYGKDMWRDRARAALSALPLPSPVSYGGADLREALEPFARLQIPKRSEGNTGFYSLYFADIERAQNALAQSTASSDDGLAKLVELRAKATPGPWTANLHHTQLSGGKEYGTFWGLLDGLAIQIGGVILGVEGMSQERGRADLELLVALVNWFDANAAALERLPAQPHTKGAE